MVLTPPYTHTYTHIQMGSNLYHLMDYMYTTKQVTNKHLSIQSGPEIKKTFSMLYSAELEIYPAHKC